jgi:hypothetical protein
MIDHPPPKDNVSEVILSERGPESEHIKEEEEEETVEEEIGEAEENSNGD